MLKNKYDLTKRELDIMNILWESSEPLMASDIVKKKSDLTLNTVQAVLRKLLKQNFIEVANISFSGTVLSRNYKAAISWDDFTISKFVSDYENVNHKIENTSVVAALLNRETNQETVRKNIDELEQMLEEYKKRI